jgi:hypothetical protein
MSSRGEPTRLEQLGHVEGDTDRAFIAREQSTDRTLGQPIGSVFIDRKMHQIISERLEKVEESLGLSPSEAAWKMTSGRFQRLKCLFGTEATLTPWLMLDVPSLEPNSTFPEAEIYNGQMRITW